MKVTRLQAAIDTSWSDIEAVKEETVKESPSGKALEALRKSFVCRDDVPASAPYTEVRGTWGPPKPDGSARCSRSTFEITEPAVGLVELRATTTLEFAALGTTAFDKNAREKKIKELVEAALDQLVRYWIESMNANPHGCGAVSVSRAIDRARTQWREDPLLVALGGAHPILQDEDGLKKLLHSTRGGAVIGVPGLHHTIAVIRPHAADDVVWYGKAALEIDWDEEPKKAQVSAWSRQLIHVPTDTSWRRVERLETVQP